MTRGLPRDHSEQPGLDSHVFNYDAAAELFAGRSKGAKAFTYLRFNRAAEALRFAVEEASADAMVGACLEVDEVRYHFDQICRLYKSPIYPLQRRS